MDIDTPIIAAFFFFAIAGAFDGLAETLKFHTERFFHIFKKANRRYWDISVSWQNKYKNGLSVNGEKFWQSSRAFVALTDGYHLARLVRNNMVIVAAMLFFSVSMVHGNTTKLYMFPAAYALCYLAYTAGFSYIYDHLFGSKE